MATTPQTGVTLLEQSQAQKEITINEALMRVDALLGGGVIDKDLATPPGSPTSGDVYIVAASATGAWSGKSGKIAYYDQIWRFIDPKEGMLLWLKDEDVFYCYTGSAWSILTTGSSGASSRMCEGRLTLTTGVPVTTSDVTGAGTVYFTPCAGNQIALYDGISAWSVLSFSQLSISLASGYSSGKPYDVFAYNNAGAVALETLVWTNDTTRATALTLQDGVHVKSGATTRRYLGTFYTTSSTTTEDSKANRYLWNYYHRRRRALGSAAESATTWNYSTASWRQANANSANQCNFVIGVSEDAVSAVAPVITTYNSTSTYRSVAIGIGLDSTTANSASITGEGRCNTSVQGLVGASYDDMVAAGKHYLAWIEKGAGADTQSFYVSNSTGYSVARLCGKLLA